MDFGPFILNPRPCPEGDCPVCGAWLKKTEFFQPASPECQAQLIEKLGEERARLKCPSAFRDCTILREECPECRQVTEFVK